MSKTRIYGPFLLTPFLVLSLCAQASDAPGATTQSSLPAVAQAKTSATRGQQAPDYLVRKAGSGLEAMNSSQKLTTRFTSEVVEVRKGNSRWGLALRGYGYVEPLITVKAVAPQATFNRVEYRHGPLTEWYMNGPVGLEQGFTLSRPPQKANRHPLTIALAVSGNMRMSLDEKHTTVNLSAPEGSVMLRYTGLRVADDNGNELRAWFEVQGQRLLLKVEDAEAHYPISIDPWVQLAQLTASDGGYLGSVAVSGDTLVAAGSAAYVFVRPESGWADMTETAKLTTSDGAGLAFVAISADRNTVVASTDSVEAAYVFVKPKTGWADITETAKLTVSDYPLCYYFGRGGVAINGGTVVVGCPAAGGLSQGAAYVFVKPTSGWASMTQTAKLTSSENQPFSNVGLTVAVSGDTIVLGAPYLSTGSQYQGAAYVFVKPAGGWADMTETAELTPSDGAPDECVGSVALHGDTVVAGAWQGQVCGGAAPAYVFVKPASGWSSMIETARLSLYGARFGPVALSSNRMVAADGAAAYVFYKPATGWSTTRQPNAKIDASGPVAVQDWPPTVFTASGNAVYVFGKQ